MLYKKIILLLLFSLGGYHQNGFAQESESKGYVRLKIYGISKPFSRIDTTALKVNDTLLQLTTGIHHIRIWMPTTYLIDSTIIIKANDTVKHSYTLKQTYAYTQYKKEYTYYKDIQNKRFGASPIGIVLVVAGTLVFDKTVAKKNYDLALRAKREYSFSITQENMDKQKRLFNLYKYKYKQNIYVEDGLYAIAGLMAINYVRILIKQYHTPAPRYTEEKLLTNVKWYVSPDVVQRNIKMNLSLQF
jgi:hypothetical protein